METRNDMTPLSNPEHKEAASHGPRAEPLSPGERRRKGRVWFPENVVTGVLHFDRIYDENRVEFFYRKRDFDRFRAKDVARIYKWAMDNGVTILFDPRCLRKDVNDQERLRERESSTLHLSESENETPSPTPAFKSKPQLKDSSKTRYYSALAA